MRYLVACFCLIAFAYHCEAQAAFVKAYIVNEKGDTLRGEAKMNPKKELDNYNKVTFKDESGIQKIYKPIKIKAYGANGLHFVAMESEGEFYFFNRLVDGDLCLLKLGFEAMRMNSVVFEEEYYLFKKGEKEPVAVKSGNFRKQLAEWTKEFPDLMEEYGEDKKFDPEKAAVLITHYNTRKAGN